jgi:hypothetical protein
MIKNLSYYESQLIPNKEIKENKQNINKQYDMINTITNYMVMLIYFFRQNMPIK